MMSLEHNFMGHVCLLCKNWFGSQCLQRQVWIAPLVPTAGMLLS